MITAILVLFVIFGGAVFWKASHFVRGGMARFYGEPRVTCEYGQHDPRRAEWLKGWHYVNDNY